LSCQSLTMISQISHIKLLIQNVKDYVNSQMRIIKLKAVDTSADFISSIIVVLTIALARCFFIFMLSFGFSFLIGAALGEISFGFFIMAAIWGMICAVLYFGRKKILKRSFKDAIIKKILG
jgi:hypothetical protein